MNGWDTGKRLNKTYYVNYLNYIFLNLVKTEVVLFLGDGESIY